MSISTNTTCTAELDAIAAIRWEISDRVSPPRKAHIERVTALLETLAGRFGIDVRVARLAGLSHDMDRDLPSWTAFALIADWRITVSRVERQKPKMLHGAISAARLQRCYGVTNEYVVSAVRHHTQGDTSFYDLGLALFVADFCEPGRRHTEAAEANQILALSSLHQMARRIIEFNQRRFGPLEEQTKRLYARLQGD